MTGSSLCREWEVWEVAGCYAGGGRESIGVYRTALGRNGRSDTVTLRQCYTETKPAQGPGHRWRERVYCGGVQPRWQFQPGGHQADPRQAVAEWRHRHPPPHLGREQDRPGQIQTSLRRGWERYDRWGSEGLRKYSFRCEEFSPAARCQVCWGERGAGPQCRHPPGGDRQADQTVATLCHCWHREERTEVRPNLWEKRIILKVEFQYLSYSYIIKERDEKHNTMSGKECSPRETVKHLFLLQFIQLWK